MIWGKFIYNYYNICYILIYFFSKCDSWEDVKVFVFFKVSEVVVKFNVVFEVMIIFFFVVLKCQFFGGICLDVEFEISCQ